MAMEPLYVRVLADLPDVSVLGNFYTALSACQIDPGANWANFFAYDGSTPEKTLHTFIVRSAATGRTRDEMLEDISTLILIGLQRGTDLEKIMRRSTGAGRGVIAALRHNYQVLPNARGMGSDRITVMRTFSLAPVLVFKIAMAIHPRVLLAGVDFTEPVHFLSLPSAAALVPIGVDPLFESLLAGILSYMERTQAFFRAQMGARFVAPAITNQDMMTVARNGPLPVEARFQTLAHVGILVEDAIAAIPAAAGVAAVPARIDYYISERAREGLVALGVPGAGDLPLAP